MIARAPACDHSAVADWRRVAPANALTLAEEPIAARQWVLTFPFAWRRRLAHDGELLGALVRIFVDTVQAFYASAPAAKTGAVMVVQRTSSDMRLNPHLHTVFLDGAYREDDAELTWAPLVHLCTRDVGEILHGPWVTQLRGSDADHSSGFAGFVQESPSTSSK